MGPSVLSVRFLPWEKSVHVEPGTTLYEAVRRAVLPIASACGADGICGRCGVGILEGAEHLPPESPDETRLKARNRVAPGLRLACKVTPHADVTITASYW